MKQKLIYLLALWAPIASAQCDVAISNWDAVSGDIVVEAINSENCGCNEFTTDDSTCETSGSPYVANNETIGHIVLGLHVEGLDYNWGCTTANNHPGWAFKAFTLFGNQVLESGDSWVANVYDSPSNNDCWAEILANDTLCTELVVWQINLSQTATTDNGGWAVNPNIAAQTQNYPDVDLSNNTAVNCALPACDTIYVDVEWITIDTIYVYEVDTLVEYVQLPPDTVHEYLTDTITLIETEYIDVIIDNYVYVTDTMTEFVAVTTYIDCETGEQCGELSPCDETSIYAPNVVTPNSDGWNDTWRIIADGACWGQWEVRIYNRWGGLVWISTSSMDEWDANVASGVYVYTIVANSSISDSTFEFNGTITVLY